MIHAPLALARWLRKLTVMRCALLSCVALLISGCGLAGSGAAGTAGAASEAQQAAQARQTEDRVRAQIESAQQQAAEQRQKAEADAQ
jgi:hypothetical protein